MIKSIFISNFKSIKEIEINCNDNFNVIIGENNIGKTTIFEAIHLWKLCYDAQIKKNKKEFYSETNSKNIPFKDMEFLRISDDMDLFCYGCSPKDAEMIVRLKLEYRDNQYVLGFTISKVQKIDNAYFQVKYEDYNQFKAFSDVMNADSYNLYNAMVLCQ